MSTARPDRFAMTTLRGDLPAASMLAVVLLVLQLFIAGASVGGAMAGPTDRHLRTAASGASTSTRRKAEDHERACPGLAGCGLGMLDGPMPDGGGPTMPAPGAIACRMSRAGPAVDPERRPLALFARASRGPPAIA